MEPERLVNKYTLKDPPDLRSAFLIEVERRKLEKSSNVQRRLDEDAAQALLVILLNQNEMYQHF